MKSLRSYHNSELAGPELGRNTHTHTQTCTHRRVWQFSWNAYKYSTSSWEENYIYALPSQIAEDQWRRKSLTEKIFDRENLWQRKLTHYTQRNNSQETNVGRKQWNIIFKALERRKKKPLNPKFCTQRKYH